MTIDRFITAHQLTADFKKIDSRPDGLMGDLNHYEVTIHRPVEYRLSMSMVAYFSVGLSVDKPELRDVLNCLTQDCIGVMNVDSFEEWADDLGFDRDSRSAERTYNACVEQKNLLLQFLGKEVLDRLIMVEPL